MFITTEELKTHLYNETIQAVAGSDTTLLTAAVKGAEAEMRGYLAAKFDLTDVFETAVTENRRDDLLVIFCKDIAVWHFIALANPGVDFDVREKRYNAAVAYLKGVVKGDINPVLKVSASVPGAVQSGSNPKRTNHI